jgi:hypothetical protein
MTAYFLRILSTKERDSHEDIRHHHCPLHAGNQFLFHAKNERSAKK